MKRKLINCSVTSDRAFYCCKKKRCFYFGPEPTTEWESRVIGCLRLDEIPVDKIATDSEGVAAHALVQMESHFDRLLVHFDVGVIKLTDRRDKVGSQKKIAGFDAVTDASEAIKKVR